MLYWQILELLSQRGIATPPEDGFELRDDSDGNGPRIEKWDTALLGARPEVSELTAVAVAARTRATVTVTKVRRDFATEIDAITLRLERGGIA